MILLAKRETGKELGCLYNFDVKIEEWSLVFRDLKYIKIKDKNTGADKTWVSYPSKMKRLDDGKWEELYKFYEFIDMKNSDFLMGAKRVLEESLNGENQAPQGDTFYDDPPF